MDGTLNARAERAVMERTGVYEMQDAAMATMVFTTAFLAGGYAPGYDHFSVGEGVHWRVSSTGKDNGIETLDIERALLDRDPNGNEWWLLRYRDDESELVAEALINPDYSMLRFRYRDPETRAVREWIPEQDTSEAHDNYAGEDAQRDRMQADQFAEFPMHQVGSTTVTVPAGRFAVAHYRVEIPWEDPDTGQVEIVSWNWWTTDEVPGRLVRYETSGSDATGGVTGELVAYRRDYSFQLGTRR